MNIRDIIDMETVFDLNFTDFHGLWQSVSYQTVK